MMRRGRFLAITSLFFFLLLACASSRQAIKPPEVEKGIPETQALQKPLEIPESGVGGLKEAKPPEKATARAGEKPISSEVVSPPSPPKPTSPVPPAPAKVSAPAVGTPSARPRVPGVVFKFDNADLYEVIRTFADILKISYVIDPRVKGVVNIHTSGSLSADEIYPVFVSILRMNGATVVKRDSIYEIVPFSEGKKLPVLPERKTSSDEGFAIEIIKPNFLPIGELEKVIRLFLSDDKEIIPFPHSNILIVADLASNIRKLREIVGLLDIDIFTDMSVRIFQIYNSDVTELAKDLGAIFSSFGISSKEAKGGGVTFTPITRSNSLLVVSSMPGMMEKVENWIKELDKPPSDESKVWVHVYYVQNVKAKDLADVLKQIYVKTKEVRPVTPEPRPAAAPTTPAPTPQPPTTRQPTATQPARTTPTPAPAAPAREEPAKVVEGDINIVVDETNNALVIRALYRDYKAILETIQKLDIYPKQVLIEVFLAEITLDETNKWGIEWFRFADTVGKYSHTVVGVASPASPLPDYAGGGLRYSIVDVAGHISAAISMAATENRLKVISSPLLLASNNKEAKIQIGQEQPILTTTYTSTDTGTSNVVTGTIEYKDIGIILTITPRISDAGLITLEIQIEDSQADTTQIGSQTNLLTVPVFKKKTAKTTLSVMEGQMIVIGGLIGDSRTVKTSGIPLLSKIPIIGGLFGKQEYSNSRAETILLMTPHVITDQVSSRNVTEGIKRKLDTVQKALEEWEKSLRR